MHVLLHVRANGDSPVSRRRHACGGNTGEGGMRARTAHSVWSLMSVGCKSGPSIARNKDAGKSQRKTPTPCVRTNRLDARRKAQGARRKAQGTRHKTQDTRHKTQGTRHKAQGTRHKTRVVLSFSFSTDPCIHLVDMSSHNVQLMLTMATA